MSDIVNLNKGNGEFFGPDDELPIDIQNKCINNAKIEVMRNGGFDKDINLEKDPEDIREPNQYCAFVSFMGPYESLRAKHDKLQVNIRGCCEEDLIKLYLEHLYNETDKYDIYTFEMNTWISIPPNPIYMSSVEKHEAQLNKIISAHKLRLEISKQVFETRKKLLQGLEEHENDIDTINNNNDLLDRANEAINNIKNDAPNIPKIEELNINNIEKVPFNYREKLAEKDGQIDGQNFAIISIVGDNTIGWALKIKGIYETEEEARVKMDILKDFDNTFEQYIVECYRWLPIDIDPNDIENKVFTNEEYGDQLNDLYNERNKQNLKAKQLVNKNPPATTSPNVILETIEDDVERIKDQPKDYDFDLSK